MPFGLQNSPYFSVSFGLKPNHKGFGASVKISSGTRETLSLGGFPLFVRHTFPRHASTSQGQNNGKTREKRDSFAVYMPLLLSLFSNNHGT